VAKAYSILALPSSHKSCGMKATYCGAAVIGLHTGDTIS
jgi:hypothetical protein